MFRAGVMEQMISRTRQAASRGAAGQKYCVMVVDDACLRVLSSCCKVYDLLEQGVSGNVTVVLEVLSVAAA